MKKWSGKKCLLVGVAAAVLVSGGAVAFRRPMPAAQALSPLRRPEYQLILDAGHGGEDGGAVSRTGVPESGINLSIVLKLDQLLGFYGVAPVLVRDADVSIYDAGCETLRQKKVSDLHNRVALVEATPNAVVLSIHQNTFSNAAYHGAQVFYREEGESQTLAAAVQEALRQGADPGNKRTPTKIPSSVYLFQHITCPAVLVECGFLSHPEEEARLRDGGYQNKLAVCLASVWLKNWTAEGSQGGKTVV